MGRRRVDRGDALAVASVDVAVVGQQGGGEVGGDRAGVDLDGVRGGHRRVIDIGHRQGSFIRGGGARAVGCADPQAQRADRGVVRNTAEGTGRGVERQPGRQRREIAVGVNGLCAIDEGVAHIGVGEGVGRQRQGEQVIFEHGARADRIEKHRGPVERGAGLDGQGEGALRAGVGAVAGLDDDAQLAAIASFRGAGESAGWRVEAQPLRQGRAHVALLFRVEGESERGVRQGVAGILVGECARRKGEREGVRERGDLAAERAVGDRRVVQLRTDQGLEARAVPHTAVGEFDAFELVDLGGEVVAEHHAAALGGHAGVVAGRFPEDVVDLPGSGREPGAQVDGDEQVVAADPHLRVALGDAGTEAQRVATVEQGKPVRRVAREWVVVASIEETLDGVGRAGHAVDVAAVVDVGGVMLEVGDHIVAVA